MSTNTPLLGLNQPATGGDSGIWGDDINNGFSALVDISVAGTNNITTDGDITLTVTNGNNSSSFSTTGTNSTVAQYYVLNCSGSRTVARNIIVPASSKTYVVINNTTGGFAITVKKSGGTGVSVANGETAIVYYNSTTGDVVKVSTFNTSQSTFGNFTIVGSGTKLLFQYSGTTILSIDNSGNLISAANVTAYGTP